MSMNEPETAGTASTERAQDVRETFTAEEFDRIARRWESHMLGIWDKDEEYECSVLLAALRIAVNVMRPGVIADAIDAALNRRDIQIDEEAIRKALLG